MKEFFILLCSIFYVSSIIAQSDTTKVLTEISVSASRIVGKNIGNNVKILDKKTITFNNPQTAANLLEQSGSVLIQRSQGGGGSPILRGFEANKVLLVVDGVRLNNAIFRGGHLQNVITIDPNMLERVEVLFGGNSLLNGSDALGGVMHFNTRKPLTVSELCLTDNLYNKLFIPNFKQQTNSYVRYSSANQEKTIHADFNLGFKKWAWLSSFSYSNFGDLRSGKNGDSKYGNWGKRPFYVERFNNNDSIVKNADPALQVGSAYKQYDVLQKLMYKPNENTSHILNFQFSNSSDIPRYDRLTEVKKDGKPTTAEWYYGPQKRLLTSYHLEHKKNYRFSDFIQLVAAYQDIVESRNTRSWASSKRTQRLENVQVMSINADFKKQHLRFIHQYGLELQANKVASKANFVNIKTAETGKASTRYPDGGAQMNTFAAYYHLDYKFENNSQINLGFRYNYTKLSAIFKDKTFFPFPFSNIKQKNGALVGSIGLRHNLNKNNTIYASISSAFRAPNVDDLTKVFDSSAGRLIVPNPNLKSEKTIGSEIVFTTQLSEKIRLQTIPFFTYYLDALTLAPSQFADKDSIVFDGQKSAVFTTQNLEKALIYGLNLNINIRFSEHLTSNTSYTYTKGRVINDNSTSPLDHISPTFGRIALDYEKEKIQYSVWTMFNGAKKSADYRLGTEDNELYSADPINGFMPAWWTLNMRYSYEFTKYTTIQLGIENIFDKQYRGFASGINAPGRNVSLTLRTKF